MLPFEKSDIRCLRCNNQFSQSDVEVMEENELPLCDKCIYLMCELTVQYDGIQDLLEFLKSEVDGNRCITCYEESVELLRIEYGDPVDGYAECRSCKAENEIEIHIEFVRMKRPPSLIKSWWSFFSFYNIRNITCG